MHVMDESLRLVSGFDGMVAMTPLLLPPLSLSTERLESGSSTGRGGMRGGVRVRSARAMKLRRNAVAKWMANDDLLICSLG